MNDSESDEIGAEDFGSEVLNCFGYKNGCSGHSGVSSNLRRSETKIDLV